MSQSAIGFLRGIGYVILFAVLDYVSAHIGTSGLVTPTVAGLLTGVIASLEHYLNDPTAPTQPPQSSQQ